MHLPPRLLDFIQEASQRQFPIPVLRALLHRGRLELGFVKSSFDVKAYSDLSMVEEAAKRLK